MTMKAQTLMVVGIFVLLGLLGASWVVPWVVLRIEGRVTLGDFHQGRTINLGELWLTDRELVELQSMLHSQTFLQALREHIPGHEDLKSQWTTTTTEFSVGQTSTGEVKLLYNVPGYGIEFLEILELSTYHAPWSPARPGLSKVAQNMHDDLVRKLERVIMDEVRRKLEWRRRLSMSLGISGNTEAVREFRRHP